MGRHLTLIALGAAALSAAACGGVQAAQIAMPDSVPLAIPAAPARVVVPAPPEAPPAQATEAAAPAATPPATTGTPNKPRGESNPRPQAPPATPPAAPQVTPTPPAAPTPLETSSNPGVLELNTRNLIGSAEKLLDKIDVKALSADGLAQYQTARRFLTQAESALKVKNIVYAFQLADKANTIATLLK